MIKIENTDVYGWEAAIRGARNPMNSWAKSDSLWTNGYVDNDHVTVQSAGDYDEYQIGPADQILLRNLANAGPDHGKFLRMITVSLDITAPLYWWKEFDTYKVGTVANSCSTMHKIHAKEFTMDDFSYEHIDDTNLLWMIPAELNKWRTLYLETNDKKYWWQMIQLLPSSYNQKRTVQMNYEVLVGMLRDRKNHKLDEWRDFCKWIKSLPYARYLIEVKDTEAING